MMNKLTITLLASALSWATASANIVISGMVDGTLSGGNPKGMELTATSSILDLSEFYVVRDTNGVGPFDTFYQLPSVSLSTGDYFYVYGNSSSETTFTGFGFPATTGNAVQNSILNVNGDDIIGIATPNSSFTSGNAISQFDMVDSFGSESQGDTNFYANSIAYRNLNAPASPAGLSDATNFTMTSYSDSELQSIFGTYEVPETSTYSLIAGLLGLTYVMLKRRLA